MPDAIAQPDPTTELQVVRDILARTSTLTAASPDTLARLLTYEIADEDVPLFSLLVEVAKQRAFWADLLTALKGSAVMPAQPSPPSPTKETS